MLLRSKSGECVVLIGMKCSSFTVVNMGTSMRAACCPFGDTTKWSVASSNCIAARTRAKKVDRCWCWISFYNRFPQEVLYPVRALALCACQLCQDNVPDSPHGGNWKCVPFGAAFWDTSSLVPTIQASDLPIPCSLFTTYYSGGCSIPRTYFKRWHQ